MSEVGSESKATVQHGQLEQAGHTSYLTLLYELDVLLRGEQPSTSEDRLSLFISLQSHAKETGPEVFDDRGRPLRPLPPVDASALLLGTIWQIDGTPLSMCMFSDISLNTATGCWESILRRDRGLRVAPASEVGDISYLDAIRAKSRVYRALIGGKKSSTAPKMQCNNDMCCNIIHFELQPPPLKIERDRRALSIGQLSINFAS